MTDEAEAAIAVEPAPRRLRKQRSGYIVNIGSTAGAVILKHGRAYDATKFAMERLSFATATDAGQFGVEIPVVEPGFLFADLLAASNAEYATGAIADYVAEGPAEATRSERWREKSEFLDRPRAWALADVDGVGYSKSRPLAILWSCRCPSPIDMLS